jgi:hypothetical protein
MIELFGAVIAWLGGIVVLSLSLALAFSFPQVLYSRTGIMQEIAAVTIDPSEHTSRHNASTKKYCPVWTG